LADKVVGEARGHGSAILVPIEPGYVLVLGGGGERILYHAPQAQWPKKYQLRVSFADESALTVTVSGWGNTLLLPEDEADAHMHVQADRVAPLTDAFTWDHFRGLFDTVDENSRASVKYFLISEPGVWGIGNGCLQDILFHARLHPRQPVNQTSEGQRRALYDAIQRTLQQMIDQGGRASERDLYNRRGGYQRLLSSKTKGEPCPACGTPIEKSQYLGGSVYVCPQCQQVG
jgi:formamidopyrimidine-DNA glycosylase